MQAPTITAQPAATFQQRTLSIDGAIQYFHDVHGLKVARSTIWKKRSTHKETFIGRRSPFGKLIFTPEEIDRYVATGDARATVANAEA
jgi:hypothetical protein